MSRDATAALYSPRIAWSAGNLCSISTAGREGISNIVTSNIKIFLMFEGVICQQNVTSNAVMINKSREYHSSIKNTPYLFGVYFAVKRDSRNQWHDIF
jgi:hypothetical protein